MLFLSNYLILVVLLVVSTLIGRSLLRNNSETHYDWVKFFIAPAIGLSTFVFVSVFLGWLPSGFKSEVCLGLFSGAAFILFYYEKEKKAFGLQCIQLALFSLIGAWGIWIMLISYAAYNPFNDTFTYLVHGQWLQNQGFGTDTIATGDHPWTTQIAIYQKLNLRMGSSFLLGFIQSLFSQDWSYQVYPSFVCFGLITAAWTFAGAISFFSNIKQWKCLLLGLCFALSYNGVVFGAFSGFPPQLYGITLGMPGLLLLGIVFKQDKIDFRLIGFVGALLASSIYCYSEIAPFLAMSCAIFCLWNISFCNSNQRKANFYKTLATFAFVVIFLNFEIARTVRALLHQSGAVVGWPVPWDIPKFFMHCIGLQSGSGDGDFKLYGLDELHWPVLILSLAFSTLGLYRIFNSESRKEGWGLCIYLFTLALFFIYFRYYSSNPWDSGIGQTWNQYKLSQWMSWGLSLFFYTGIARAIQYSRTTSYIAYAVVIAISTLSIISQHGMADSRTQAIRNATNSNYSSFSVYEELRSDVLNNLKPQDSMYLNLQGDHLKSKQIISYFLNDIKLSSNWLDDVYIFPHLPEVNRNTSWKKANYILSPISSYSSENEQSDIVFRRGIWELSVPPKFIASIRCIDGGYNKEMDESGWWVWTNRSLEFEISVESIDNPIELPLVALNFTYLAAIKACSVGVIVTDSNTNEVLLRDDIVMNEWGTYSSLTNFNMAKHKSLAIKVFSDDKTVTLENDERSLLFLIKNLEFIPANYK